MPLQFPDDVPQARFLTDYWQRRPLLMRKALPSARAPLDAATLAGMAMEVDIESRLIQRRPDGHWTLRHGPFRERDFETLPARGWTLLVQDVDKYVDDIARLRRQFDFLPTWRVDDVMISYATDGGSVGPHVDQYDVFLVQADGARRWQIGDPARPTGTRTDGGLALLTEFQAIESWRLEPGDVLYLPPGVPHWGIADGPCMTCSVGFRAPSWRELLLAWSEERCASLPQDRHFVDPPLDADRHPAEITTAALAQWRALLSSLLAVDDDELARAFGRLVTETKAHLQPDAPRESLPDGTRLSRLRRHPAARLAFARRRDGSVWLFANGEVLRLPPQTSEFAEQLCRDPLVDTDAFRHWAAQPTCREVLAALVAGGVIEVCDD